MIDIDFREFMKAMNDYPNELVRNLTLASKKGARDAQEYARSHHRFETDKGDLEKSIVGYGTAEKVELILHDKSHPVGTSYGWFIHKGFKSWAPDRFINEAMDKTDPKIMKYWQDAINKTNEGF